MKLGAVSFKKNSKPSKRKKQQELYNFQIMLEGKVYTTEQEKKFVCMFGRVFLTRPQIQGIKWIIIGSYLSLERAVNI